MRDYVYDCDRLPIWAPTAWTVWLAVWVFALVIPFVRDPRGFVRGRAERSVRSRLQPWAQDIESEFERQWRFRWAQWIAAIVFTPVMVAVGVGLWLGAFC